jgi:hypothetical protein
VDTLHGEVRIRATGWLEHAWEVRRNGREEAWHCSILVGGTFEGIREATCAEWSSRLRKALCGADGSHCHLRQRF